MARKGQFKKGGGRHGGGGGGGGRGSKGGADSATAIVVMPQRQVRSQRRWITSNTPRPRGGSMLVCSTKKGKGKRKGRKSAGAGVTPMKLVIGAVALSSAAGTNNGPLGGKIYDIVQKIPGAKTLGGAATAGLALGAIGKYTGFGGAKIRPWLKAAGVIGLVLAAAKIGEAGTAFKWVGDDEVHGGGADSVMDVEI